MGGLKADLLWSGRFQGFDQPDHLGLVEVWGLAAVERDPRRWRGRRGIAWRSEVRDPFGRLTLFGPMPDGWLESLNGFIELGLAALIAVRIRDRQRPAHLRIVAPVRKTAPSPIRDQHRNACARLAHEEARLAKDPTNREALNAAAAWRHVVTALEAVYDVGSSHEARAVTQGAA